MSAKEKAQIGLHFLDAVLALLFFARYKFVRCHLEGLRYQQSRHDHIQLWQLSGVLQARDIAKHNTVGFLKKEKKEKV